MNSPLAGLGILAISIIAASNPNYSDRSFRGTRIRSTDLSFGSIGIPIRPPSFERKIGSRTVRVTLLVIQKINKAEEKEKRRRVITEEKNINILYCNYILILSQLR